MSECDRGVVGTSGDKNTSSPTMYDMLTILFKKEESIVGSDVLMC